MKKQVISLMLVLSIIASLITAMPMSASAETWGDYTYVVVENEAIIAGFNTSVSGAITIPSKINGYPVTSIGDWAFYDCYKLTSVSIPDSVTSIGEGAFSYCSSLTSINIPDSVSSIDYGAFRYCESLRSINIPNGVTSIDYSTFANCRSLTSVIIPNSVTSIGDYAFEYCESLRNITIPNSVTSIGDWAFFDCLSLTRINIPNSVTSIGDYAFYDCLSLASINIPDSVTSIGDGAFAMCWSLTSINIPDSVTSIGDYAFDNCYSLSDVYYSGSKNEWKKIYIGGGNTCLTDATIHYKNREYIIRYNANGGSCVISSLKLEEGTFVPAPPRPTRNGYTFTGWYANRSCTGTPYISASGITNRTVTNNITLYAGWKKNDIIQWGKDTFSFGNSGNFFHSDCYRISDEYYNILTEDLNWIEKINVNALRKQKNDGSCFGMAVVMSLIKQGKLAPGYFDKGAKTAYEMSSPKNNPDVESLINYYLLSQRLPDIETEMDKQFIEAMVLGSSAELAKKLVNALKDIDNTGIPIVLNFEFKESKWSWLWKGHSVLAYKVEDDGSRYVVHIADPNFLMYVDQNVSSPGNVVWVQSGPKDMYISYDYKTISYSMDSPCSTNDGTLRLHSVFTDTSLYDNINIQEKLSKQCVYNPNARLFNIEEIEEKAELTTNYPVFAITDGEKSMDISGESYEGELDISLPKTAMGIDMWSYNLANETGYTVTPDCDMDEYNTNILYNKSESLIITSSEQKPVVQLSPEGAVNISSTDVGRKSAMVTVNDENIPWNNVSVETNAKTLTVTPMSEGVVEITSDTSLKGAKVTLNYENNNVYSEISEDIYEVAISYAEENGVGYIKLDGCEDDTLEMTYTITFASTGGSTVESATGLQRGDFVEEPEVPIFEGFIFDGWYSDAQFENEWDFEENTVEDNMTLYAKWVEDPEYHCLLSLMNGDEATQIVVTNGEVVGLDAFEQEFEKEGHLFLGWSDTEETATVIYGTKDTVTVNGDTTLYPVYKAMPCTVSNISKTDSGCVVNTKLYGIDEGCIILVAGYKSGRLVTVKDIPYTKDEEDITLVEDVDMVSVMVWRNFATAYPITEAEILTLSD